MAKGISELDVHQAADDIIAAGERPTVERIRAHLGTGSPNTVTRWLETWWQTVGFRLRQRAIEAAVPGIPEGVAHLTQRLWQAALQDASELAHTQLESARHALEERERVLEGERATLTLAIEATQKRDREAQVQTQAAIATAEQLSAQVSQLTAQVQDLLRQRDGAYGRAERLEQELDAVRRSLGEATTAHEGERRALQAHVRAVEDRAHAEVDRHRQALQSGEQEWGRERFALTTKLRESEERAIVAANREQQALRRLEGVNARADGLDAQLTSLKETTRQVTDALRQARTDKATTSRQSKPRRPAPTRGRELPQEPTNGKSKT